MPERGLTNRWKSQGAQTPRPGRGKRPQRLGRPAASNDDHQIRLHTLVWQQFRHRPVHGSELTLLVPGQPQ